MFTCGPGLFGGVASDPYWPYVVSLCHYQGTNGSTSIIDQVSGVVWSAGTGTSISTANPKFGSSSLLVGTGGSTTTNNITVSSSAFTFECFVYTSSATLTQVVQKFNPSAPNFVIASSNLQFSNGSAWVYATGGTVPVNQWFHLAASYTGGILYFFINGIMKGNSSTSMVGGTNTFSVGSDLSSNYIRGYIAESRITSGIGRYTTNFTPPTSMFPNH